MSKDARMTTTQRVTVCTLALSVTLLAQAALEAMTAIERPELRAPLSTLPMVLGDWVGQDEPVDAEIVRQAQTDDYLSRIYEDRRQPGRRVTLWMNFSRKGTNLRHSPSVCLPGAGWEPVESLWRLLQVPAAAGDETPLILTKLAYSKGELVQSVGFWYYIFGEGRLDQYVRGLKISNRSSHGRTTRGSSLTVEIFCPGSIDTDGETLRDFADQLVKAIEPVLPANRASYFTP